MKAINRTHQLGRRKRGDKVLSYILRTIPALSTAVMIVSCTPPPSHPLYQQSEGRYSGTGFNSFSDYQQATRNWLDKNRVPLSKNKEKEIDMNMPFSVPPISSNTTNQKKGIILVHGLGDSPWSFRDLAQEFSKSGYLVRTILLAGHGSRPADMLSIGDNDWKNLVREQVSIMKKEVDKVSLGGFSTGANLVTSYALHDQDVRSLFLFSPAFKSNEPLDFLAPFAAMFKDWLFAPEPPKEGNEVRYSSVPLKGFAQYYQTSTTVLRELEATPFERPVFIATSEADSVVDVGETLKLFKKRFSHPASRLAWFGSSLPTHDLRIETFPGRVPEFSISNFSHMGILFSPQNSYYGYNSLYRMCQNGQTELMRAHCEEGGGAVWYSAWGYQEDGKSHARLTFNPYFDQMINLIHQVIRAS